MIEKMRELNQDILDRKMVDLKSEGKAFCSRCENDDFSPNIECFEVTGEIVCDDCAEEVFEEHSQFGVGA
ncbi:MAG: hypothetical protein AB7Q04_13425 [Steroidobacteraceae bacterium]